MFFVFNKPKIYSYLVVFSTVVILFFTAAVLSEANNMETLTASSNIEESICIEKFNTDKNEIAIMIDCLNDDSNIEKILEILGQYNVKANFALYGDWVKNYPELTKKIYSSGNSIINMSNEYKDMSDLSLNEAKKQIEEGANKLNTLLNTEIKLVRCPYNKENDDIIKLCQEEKYKIIKGSIETLDYQGIEANVIWDNIKNKITSGDIIVMNSNSEHILEEVEIVVKLLLQREYELINLDNL